MTESPDSPAESGSTQAENETKTASVAKTRKEAEEPKLPRRERILRMALVTIGAALVASIFSLYSQRDDADPSSAANQTAQASSGSVTVEIEVSTDDADRSTQIVTRYQGDDYDTTLNVNGDTSAYSTATSVQQLITVNGESHYRNGEGDFASADSSAVVLDEEIALPTRTLGWSSSGLVTFVEALDLAIDNTVVNDLLKASITVAEVRALDEVPLAIEVLIDEQWAWSDDQSIDVEVQLDRGNLRELAARAADESPERVGGLLSISTSTIYIDLGTAFVISAPTE